MATSRYRIVLRGRLSERFESAFDGMTLEHGPNRTVLTGDVRDQAQLYGLIDRLQEFGIELLAVEPADSSDGGLEPGRLPGSGGWSVAVEHFGLVLVPRAGRPVRVHDQGPAPAVDDDLVVERAEQNAVLDGRVAAVGFVAGVVDLGPGGLVAPAGPLAVPVPQDDRVADPGRDRLGVADVQRQARPAQRGRRAAGGAGS